MRGYTRLCKAANLFLYFDVFYVRVNFELNKYWLTVWLLMISQTNYPKLFPKIVIPTSDPATLIHHRHSHRLRWCQIQIIWAINRMTTTFIRREYGINRVIERNWSIIIRLAFVSKYYLRCCDQSKFHTVDAMSFLSLLSVQATKSLPLH